MAARMRGLPGNGIGVSRWRAYLVYNSPHGSPLGGRRGKKLPELDDGCKPESLTEKHMTASSERGMCEQVALIMGAGGGMMRGKRLCLPGTGTETKTKHC